MKTYRVSTITLARASTEVSAESAEAAIDAAKSLPESAWETGGVFGDVDLDGECVEAEEVCLAAK